jgi:hypothetical protein
MQFECFQVVDTKHGFYQDAMQIYFDSFPPNERQPLSKIAVRVAAGKSLLFVGTLNSEVIAMALLWDFNNSPFTLLDYMAVAEKSRNQSYGTNFFNILTDQIKHFQKHLIIEVEHPSFGENRAQRNNRILFYLKNGAYLMNNVPYVLPTLDGTNSTDMLLMIAPKYREGELKKSVIIELITRLYTEVYEKPIDEPQLNQIINQVPAQIDLINTLI